MSDGPTSPMDVIDLFASGDSDKIKCVLLPTLGGTVAGGIVGSVLTKNPTATALLAVLGGFAGSMSAYKMCGGGSTRGSFKSLFTSSKFPRQGVDEYEKQLMASYGLSASQARYISKTAAVYLINGGEASHQCGSLIERKQAIHLLLVNAGLNG